MGLPPPDAAVTALVTGASSGIGVEIARQLASRGYGLTLVARRKERLDELAAELADSYGIRAEALPTDLTDEAARAALPGRVDDLGLTVGILVNNAGLSTVGPVHTADPAAELRMIRTDVEAVVHLTTLFVAGMVERGSGGILDVASTAAFQPMPGQAGYAASKAFVLSYGHAVRGELRGTGVQLTTLCPGPVQTEFGETAGFDEAEANDALPSFMWEKADVVARCGVDGLFANRAVAIPGVANRVTATMAQVTPRTLLVPILARQHPAMKR